MSTPHGPDYESTKISFADLARNDEDFAKIFKANKGHIDYQNPEHVQQLTKSLLKRDFGLQIELPSDRLCPPVPQRWAYIQWISRLLDSTTPTFPTPANPNRPITGIDIGTGASAIYPLLACATHPTWKFIATELDVHSITSAAFNIALNNLAGDITLHRPSLGSSVDLLGPPCTPPLLPPLPPGPIDFTMCNPPFFASQSELSATWTKSTPPSAVCTGSESEMITPGGEVAFVTRLVAESAAPGTRDRVQWFSSLLGRLVSLRPVVEALRQAGCANWAVGVLRPGGKTRRWVVAWSWGAWRPSGDVARGDVGAKDLLPFPPEFTVPFTGMTHTGVATCLDAEMRTLDMRWTWDADTLRGAGFATGAVWTRAARRKRHAGGEGMETNAPVVFGFGIEVREEGVEVRWVYGVEAVVFESFCGMVKRLVAGAGDRHGV